MTKLTIEADLDTITASTSAALAALFSSKAGTAVVTQPSTSTPGTGTTPSTGTDTPSTGTPVVTAPAVNPYFPADAGEALFPSPENSRMVRNSDGSISGKPYLLDKDGMMTRLVPAIPPTDQDRAAGLQDGGIEVAGQRRFHYFGTTVSSAIVRDREVYVQISGGQWQHFTASMGSFYNATLPDAALPVDPNAPVATVPTTKVRARPVLKLPAPGSSSTVLLVGPGRPYADLAAAYAVAHDGDTIDITGTYTTPPPRADKNVLVRSTTGATFDMKGVTGGWASGGKAVFVGYAEQAVFDGLTVLDAVGPDSGFGAFRADDNNRAMTVRNCVIKRCTNGIKGSGGDGSVIVSENNQFDGNGLGPDADYCHHIYTHHNDFFSEKGSVFVNCAGAHDIKVRGPEAVIDGAQLSAKRSSCIDLCEGMQALAVIQNCVFHKDADAENHLLFSIGAENNGHGFAGALLLNNTYEAFCDAPMIQCEGNSQVVTLTGGKRSGNPLMSMGSGKVLGL